MLTFYLWYGLNATQTPTAPVPHTTRVEMLLHKSTTLVPSVRSMYGLSPPQASSKGSFPVLTPIESCGTPILVVLFILSHNNTSNHVVLYSVSD